LFGLKDGGPAGFSNGCFFQGGKLRILTVKRLNVGGGVSFDVDGSILVVLVIVVDVVVVEGIVVKTVVVVVGIVHLIPVETH
jgi:hypothetical protein